MHPLSSERFAENFRVGFFGKHEHLKVLPLPGDGIPIALEVKEAAN
jgi:hypothetical protein